MKNLQKLLELAYHYEINLQIDWFWDGCVDMKIGDEYNGYKAQATVDVKYITEWLYQNLKQIYPTLNWDCD